MLSRRGFLGLGIAVGGATVAASAIASTYSAALNDAQGRIAGRSSTIPTRFGVLEYAMEGAGRPLLMIHGTGGGFDQGLTFAQRFSAGGYHVIAPSRFGYLGSAFAADPSSANQADAFVELLDALRIEKLPVIGGSAGALSAIEFAIRHPDRCSALIALVPATYAPERPALVPMGAVQERAMRAMLGSDFLFWSALHLMRDQMVGTMLATDPELVANASPAEQARVERILREIMPVSRRTQGLLNDAILAGNPALQPIEDIKLPTLSISVEDDRFGTADAARYIASRIEGSKLVVYPSGGHVWIGHDEQVFADADAFLKTVA